MISRDRPLRYLPTGWRALLPLRAKCLLLVWLGATTAVNALLPAGTDWICFSRGESTETTPEGGLEPVLAAPHLLRRGVRRAAPSTPFPLMARQHPQDEPRPRIVVSSPKAPPHIDVAPLRC